MKKIFFVGILGILFGGISFAQTPKIGVTAGLNTSNVISNTNEANPKYKAGFQAGVIADFGITEKFSIMPELLFGQRGYKVDAADVSAGTGSVTLNYLQLPINAAYKFDVGMGSKLFIFAGPYLGYGLSISVKGGDLSSSDDVKFGSQVNQIKPFDFGIDVGLGYQFEKIFFKLQWNPGLTNWSNYSGSSVKNTNIAVTAGYFFN